MKPGKIVALHKINVAHAEYIKIAWLTDPKK